MGEEVKVFRVKVVLLGDGGVGKTSLIRRYVAQSFSEDYLKTLGTSISKRNEEFTTETGPIRVDMTIWDIMGQKQLFDLIQEAYLRGAQGALAVFDVTRRQTMEDLRVWVGAARREDPRVAIAVLGNKIDMVDRRMVDDADAVTFCQDLDAPYSPASAKTGLNVEAAFRLLARRTVGQRVVIGG